MIARDDKIEVADDTRAAAVARRHAHVLEVSTACGRAGGCHRHAAAVIAAAAALPQPLAHPSQCADADAAWAPA
eukprot:SAG22_NODE_190_length_15715_cov_21.164980_7_plen_74_part_00